MELGELVGQGAGAEVFALDERRVIKLFRPGVDPRIPKYEVSVVRAVLDAGAPAPEVLDVVMVEGRPGIVYARYDGPTLLDCLMNGQVSPDDGGQILAKLHHAIHVAAYKADVKTFRAWTLFTLEILVSHGLPPDVQERVRELVMSLPEDGVLCHGDGHAGNVLMTAAGPLAIDWISAMNSNPLVDVARQHLTLTILAPAAPRESLLSKVVDESFISTYAALSGTDAAGLLSEVKPYMVVMAAMRMSESASSEAEKRRLTEYVRSNAGLA